MDIYLIAMALSAALAVYLCRTHSSGGILTDRRIQYFPTFIHAFIALLPLTLVLLFRWEVGSDSYYGASYQMSYLAASLDINLMDFEWGFYMLTKAIAFFNLPFFWYLFIISLFYMICISYSIHKVSVCPPLSVLILVLLMSYFDAFAALRQSTALAVCMIAGANWISAREPISTRKQDITFILTILAASLLHSSALLYIPVFLVSRRPIGTRNLVIIASLCILFTPILQIVFRIVGSLVKDGFYGTKGFASSYALLSLLIFLLCLWKNNRIQSINPRACFLINHSLIVFIMMLNSNALILPFRIYDALRICYVFTIPYISKSFRTKSWGRFVAFLLLAILFVFYINSMYINPLEVSEYRTVFEDFTYYSTLP